MSTRPRESDDPVTSESTVRSWLGLLTGGRPVSDRLVERVTAHPGHLHGAARMPGRVSPARSRTSAHVLVAAYGDTRLASACATSGSWHVAPTPADHLLFVFAVEGELAVRRGHQSVSLSEGSMVLLTDDRPLEVHGVEAEGSLLVGFVPASRVRAAHREISLRGPVVVPASPLMRAAVAYAGTLLVATSEDDAGHGADSGDPLVAIVDALADQALAGAGHASRTGDVRRAALRSIERQHRSASFGVDDIARDLYISRRQLYRAFPDAGGIAGMIAQRRLQTAERIMTDRPEMQLAEVAALSGFSTAGVMRAHFRRVYGTTPQRHRDWVIQRRMTDDGSTVTTGHVTAPIE